jgi:Flp pilus assembly protein TadG
MSAAVAVREAQRETGSAIVEFVFLALVMLVPLVYLIAAVAVVQRNTLAVTQAARDAGRAFATSKSVADAQRRVAAAVRLALADQGLPDDAQLRFVQSGTGCDAPAVVPHLTPGTEFTVCETRRVRLPGVPSLLAGRGIRTVGVFVVHIDDYRAGPRQ